MTVLGSFTRWVGCLLAGVVLVLGAAGLLPATAAAESLCTDTWTGPAEAEWKVAGDWSAGHVPTSSDVACIGSGKTVKVSEKTSAVAAVVQGEGTLKVSEATIEVGSVLEGSTIKGLTIEFQGVVTGAATITATGSFKWLGGTMSGSGSTVVASGVTGVLTGSHTLTQRTWVNEGTIDFTEGGVVLKEGAQLNNKGTFNANAEGSGFKREGAGATPSIMNTGTFQKTEKTGGEVFEGVPFDNEGTVKALSGKLRFRDGGTSGVSHAGSWLASTGAEILFEQGTYSLGATVPLEGTIKVTGFGAGAGASVSAGKLEASSAHVSVDAGEGTSGTLELTGPGISTVSNFTLGVKGILTGPATLEVSSAFSWQGGAKMTGTGKTVVKSGVTGAVEGGSQKTLKQRQLVNEGTLTMTESGIAMLEGAEIRNQGTFNANADSSKINVEGAGAAPRIVNTGLFQKSAGTLTTTVEVNFENYGGVRQLSGQLLFTKPIMLESASQYGGSGNPSAPGHPCAECGDPVVVATGDLVETQTDFAIGGRGVGLNLVRTYNSQAAAESAKGIFGYGWSNTFSDSISVASKVATLHQANGGTVAFKEGAGGSWTPPGWTQDTLSGSSEAGYTLTYPGQTKYKFAGASGRLESVTDRNGNATTLAYNGAGRLETITDPASRKITLAYNGEGLVESAKDPMGHVVKYTYEASNLKTVTMPGEAGSRWTFVYNGSRELTEMTDGRAGKTTNEYNGSFQLTKQTDPAGRKLSFEYAGFHTKITNNTTGSVTDDWFTSNDEPYSITRGFGTASATTETLGYNEGGYVTSVTDGNGHVTKYGYDGEGNRTSMLDANEHETKWTYNATHDVETITVPSGEKTTIKRDAKGNPEVVERPAPEAKTQTTKYKYDAHGLVESMTDPLERVTKYEYDSAGDKTAETDPEGDKRTWVYDEDSRMTSTVSPRGNVEGAEAAKYTTKTERDAQERPIKLTDPLGHETKYAYDGDGNLEKLTDPNSHATTYTYDADNERTKIKAPNGTVTESGYDGAGQVTSQTDGNKHVTKYTRNIIEQVTEVEDPLKHKTTKDYDLAGNLKTLTDPPKRTTTYKYDSANQLTEIKYSEEATPSVKYEYDANGNRLKMVDGTGTSKYTYDQLGRLTETEDGHKDIAKYEYDLANQQTKITYPNTKAVTRAYDKAGRLEKVTDWSEHTTTFKYDVDSDLTATVFPSGTTNEDKYTFNEADQQTGTEMKKGAEVLATLAYTRDNAGQLTTTKQTGLPGEAETAYTYDENDRLTKAGTTGYEYDPADNPTKTGASTNTYNEADELIEGTGVKYSYDELGERTKRTPTLGAATIYGYDQAGNLTSVTSKLGELPGIEDTYAYNGDGLRVSQTITLTTTFLAWDVSHGLPLLINDGTNSYIYGSGGLPIEQISGTGTVLYLHHDQQGSTRALTGSTGAVEGTATYDAYGNTTGHQRTGNDAARL
jgi:YD repeat-containing protein